MKKIRTIFFALIILAGLGAGFSSAATNIDSTHHLAKVLIDGSYIDFACVTPSPSSSSSTTRSTSTASYAFVSVAQTYNPTASLSRTGVLVSDENPASVTGQPGVRSISATTSSITDAFAGTQFDITVRFETPMNTSADPVFVILPDLFASGTLEFQNAVWSDDGLTYTVTSRVVDRNEVQSTVNVSIMGAVPLDITAGTVPSFTAAGLFSVDMGNSAASSVVTASGPCDVFVSDYSVTGVARGTSTGDIDLTPYGGGVFNDGAGNLSGYAWGNRTGWVNFRPAEGGVTIDSDGYFHGYAWSEYYGWISFNCDTTNDCADDTYKVRTSWRPTGSAVIVTMPADISVPVPVDPVSTPVDPIIPNPPVEGSVGDTVPPAPGSGSATDTQPPVPTPPSNPSPTSSGSSSPTPGSSVTPSEIPTIPGENLVPENSETSLPPEAPEGISENYPRSESSVVTGVIDTLDSLSSFLDTPRGESTGKAIAAIGIVAMLMSISNDSWRSLFSVLAIRRRKPWGTVYDSVTKQPLDPAYVVLMKDGVEVTTSITDLDGRYGFLAEPGTYRIVANKTNYVFPSARLAGRMSDELYTDLYFGEDISVMSASDVIRKNIPLDPIGTDWNEEAKRAQHLMRFHSKRDLWVARIAGALFWIGFVLSIFAFVTMPGALNLGILALYVVVFVLRETVLAPKKRGSLTDSSTGLPLGYAIVRIYSAALGTEIAHKAANAIGKYFMLIPNGRYYAKIERKNPDGTYTPAYTSEQFDITGGVVDKNFVI